MSHVVELDDIKYKDSFGTNIILAEVFPKNSKKIDNYGEESDSETEIPVDYNQEEISNDTSSLGSTDEDSSTGQPSVEEPPSLNESELQPEDVELPDENSTEVSEQESETFRTSAEENATEDDESTGDSTASDISDRPLGNLNLQPVKETDDLGEQFL